eukprot:scaffold216477_cov17-Tisochrysis_lutea.AAC.1
MLESIQDMAAVHQLRSQSRTALMALRHNFCCALRHNFASVKCAPNVLRRSSGCRIALPAVCSMPPLWPYVHQKRKEGLKKYHMQVGAPEEPLRSEYTGDNDLCPGDQMLSPLERQSIRNQRFLTPLGLLVGLHLAASWVTPCNIVQMELRGDK